MKRLGGWPWNHRLPPPPLAEGRINPDVAAADNMTMVGRHSPGADAGGRFTRPDPFPREDVRAAVEGSVFARLPAPLQRACLANAVRSEVPGGRRLEGPPLCLVVGGLVRVALSAADGRRFVVSYLGRGDVAGLARLTGRSYPLEFEAVSDCQLLRLDEAVIEKLRQRHPEVGVAVADQLNRHLDDVLHETALAAFGHVRQRVSRHLLALAVVSNGGPPACRITHQGLADAVAAARESVSRVIAELRAEGLLAGEHGGLLIPDPERLRRELAP